MAAIDASTADSRLGWWSRPKTDRDFDRGANPFGVMFADCWPAAEDWVRRTVAMGATPRVISLIPGACAHGRRFGWLMEMTIGDPCWASDDAAGRARFTAAARMAFASVVGDIFAMRHINHDLLAGLMEAIPVACYDALDVGERIATRAVDRGPDLPPHPELMCRLLDRIRPSVLRDYAARFPAEPWSMRAFAHMAMSA